MDHCGVLMPPLHTVVDNRHNFLHSSDRSKERNSRAGLKRRDNRPKTIMVRVCKSVNSVLFATQN